MILSAEDNLRLNVLLAQDLHAVRIDESKMTVFALTEKGEASIPLNAIGKDETYIKEVKALLSTHVMGSPGGYPVYLKRWTRMGQARDESLAQLLLLGEPEAVVAAVHASGLTDALAARAWWAMPTAENARRMLEKQAVVKGKTGKLLAEFLLEFLPFEEDQSDIIESVRLVLQPGLISQQEKEKLWSKTKNKRSFYVGFLLSSAENLPFQSDAHAEYENVKNLLKLLTQQKNPYALMLVKVFSAKGQATIKTIKNAFEKPGNQDVVVSLLFAVSTYFVTVVPEQFSEDDMESICSEARLLCATSDEILEVQAALKGTSENIQNSLYAIIVLSCLGVKLVDPIFSRTDAIGTVMRKKIKPVTDPVFECLQLLRNV
ncbi:MAG: sulfur reduction protein DsrS [Gammaproteobacteria bacterium]|nr:sulfur reduction protein DsrS [Gammaproteobacteria bacterium]